MNKIIFICLILTILTYQINSQYYYSYWPYYGYWKRNSNIGGHEEYSGANNNKNNKK
ncbi:hypothetical protein Mgra_00004664 [Meloidogyne graminicola]|uniref:Uncharacterized protein n=1 Tax=Meloidogyne graminicola TaxID=189291 RepID=A0A8S9ZR51_9BILA|nr:hypothetical protein Mgra_00004664 [Meloidogyne graminicola]